MKRTITALLIAIVLIPLGTAGARGALLVPMDEAQTDHLKAYGLAYWVLESPRNFKVEWLLNYRGGSFLIEEEEETARKARLMGVAVKAVGPAAVAAIHQTIEGENMETVLLEKAPKIAVYTPPADNPWQDPWDDAVILAMEYAEIPYDTIWDEDILTKRVRPGTYDWLHLHHEDFTGQFGKFYMTYNNQVWYRAKVATYRERARAAGFPTVWAHKRAVVLGLLEYMSEGGFLFAMCSATDTFDIALAAGGRDIVPQEFDGNGIDAHALDNLRYDLTVAFEDFDPVTSAAVYEHSNIDACIDGQAVAYKGDHFTLFDFSAKFDRVPCMLVQNHVNAVKDFRGQCTAFRKEFIKDEVTILGEFEGENVAKYIHGTYGKGTFTFYAGHDPEDYAHKVHDKPTDLSLHKHSPGYRLILNNILFPAAKKKKRITEAENGADASVQVALR